MALEERNLAETIASIVHAQSNVDWRTGEEGTANYGVEDSFFNQYTQPNIFDYTKPYMLYDGLTDNHDVHQFASNLKLLRYYRKECLLKKKKRCLELYLMMKSIQLLLTIENNLI